VAVRFNVVLGCVLGMLGSMNVVAMREVGVVGGLFVVASFVMLGSFGVMVCGVLVVLRCLRVMMGCFL
jgi:branched-subunit amino acid permease